MADFKTAYQKTSVVEGGYSNDSRDSGGETWKGISRNNEINWDGWPIIDAYKKLPNFPKNLSSSAELEIAVQTTYKNSYWEALNLNFINDQRMANELYDTGVNMGIGTAGKFLQRVLNVATKTNLAVDGKIGSKTIGVFNSLSDSDKYMVWKLFNCLQGEKYISICENNPSQEIFLLSWVSRVFET
jgi:lysozyme family protein